MGFLTEVFFFRRGELTRIITDGLRKRVISTDFVCHLMAFAFCLLTFVFSLLSLITHYQLFNQICCIKVDCGESKR
jgi:hypothetical protein